RLTDDPAFDDQATLSPDGRQLAFVSTRTGHAEVWLLDLRTKALKNLTERSGGSFRPTWSPDGSWIAFSSDRASPHPVRPGSFESPSWSPDGMKVVFHRETATEWPPAREEHSRDPAFRLFRTGIFPSYSPDGTGLISGTGTRALAHNGILSMRADGTNRRIIFDDPERSSVAAVFSPKGDRIAFGLGSFFGGMIGRPATLSNIALVNADGSGLQLLTTGDVNDGFPSWSPDARRLVFRTASGSGRGLRILDVATKQTTVLTDGVYI